MGREIGWRIGNELICDSGDKSITSTGRVGDEFEGTGPNELVWTKRRDQSLALLPIQLFLSTCRIASEPLQLASPLE